MLKFKGFKSIKPFRPDMEWLSNMEDTSIERKSQLPSSGFFYPNSIEEKEEREKAIESFEDSNTVVLTDPDADGLGAVLAIQQEHPDATFIACGPHSKRLDLEDGIELAIEHLNETDSVYIVDIGVDSKRDIQQLGELNKKIQSIKWFDHHEWDEEIKNYVESRVDMLRINTGDHKKPDSGVERSAAEMVMHYLETVENCEFSETIRDGIHVIGVHDCWRKVTDDEGKDTDEFVDERARDISDFADIAEPEEFISAIEEHGGDIIDDEDIYNRIEESREKQKQLRDLAIERTETRTVDGVKIALPYGRGPTNSIADKLRLEEECDLIVHIKPSGGIGLRGSENFEKCEKVAKKLGGGGHDRAAGAFVPPKEDGDDSRFDTDMLDYAEHWKTHGEWTKQQVMSKVEDVIKNP